MTKERAIEALNMYSALLESLGAKPERSLDRDYVGAAHRGHLAWMCVEAVKIFSEDRIEKGMRWLGFIQGALWTLDLRTIDEMRRDNMPADETFVERESGG